MMRQVLQVYSQSPLQKNHQPPPPLHWGPPLYISSPVTTICLPVTTVSPPVTTISRSPPVADAGFLKGGSMGQGKVASAKREQNFCHAPSTAPCTWTYRACAY